MLNVTAQMLIELGDGHGSFAIVRDQVHEVRAWMRQHAESKATRLTIAIVERLALGLLEGLRSEQCRRLSYHAGDFAREALISRTNTGWGR